MEDEFYFDEFQALKYQIDPKFSYYDVALVLKNWFNSKKNFRLSGSNFF